MYIDSSGRKGKLTVLAMAVCYAAGLPALLAGTTSALAANPVLEEIIVSARKRSESLQEVPLSIQALTAEDIEQSNILDLSDLARFAPGVSLFENVDRGYGQVFIRGMQNTPPVGDTTRELASVFLDGIFFTGGVGAINTDNIARVEVIRGPQSALLGRSTFSGAINFITRTPAEEFAGNVSATLGSDEEYRVSGAIEGPIIKDNLAGRLSGRYRSYGGQYENSLNGDALGEEEDTAISGQLYFTPVDWLSAKLTASRLEQDDGPAASALAGKVGAHNFTSASGTTFVKGEVELDGPIAQNRFPTSNSDIFAFTGSFIPFDSTPNSGRLNLRRNGLEREFNFVSLDVNADLSNDYMLSYLAGYSDEEAARLQDFELSAEDNYYLSRRTDSESSSHELRLTSPDESRLRWLAGLYYLEQEIYERDPGGIFGPGVFGFLGLQPGQVVVLPGPRPIIDREIENSAVFGSIAYDFTPQLTVSLEGRWQDDKLEDVVDPLTGATLSGSTDAFLPRVIAEYQLNEDVMLYGVVAKGLRPTTINSQYAARSDTEKAIIRAEYPELNIQDLAPEEEIISYELGAKTTWMDGRFVFNVNAFYSDWTDRQDLTSLLADLNGDGAPESTLVTVSGTDVEVYGIELDSSFSFTENWYASLTAAWNESELTDDGQDGTIARFFLQETPNGQRLPQVPEFSGALISQYSANLGSTGLEWFVRGEGIYTGSRYASTLNLAETGDSFDVNLRVGVQDERYSATLFVENLFDDDTFESMRSNADCATTSACALQAYEVVLPRERSVGVSLTLRF